MFIATVNQKGGVGKTTLAAHLALWYARHGHAVALIDTDEQQTAARWVRGSSANIEIVSEHDADRLIEHAPELVARRDIVVADGPANLAECSRALLLVADVALVPCGPTIPELEATATTVRMLRNAAAVRASHLPKPLLVLTRMRPARFRLSREATEAAPALGIPVAHNVLPFREAIADAPGQRRPVWSLGRSAEHATNDMTQLLKEIEAYAGTPTLRAGHANGRAASLP